MFAVENSFPVNEHDIQHHWRQNCIGNDFLKQLTRSCSKIPASGLTLPCSGLQNSVVLYAGNRQKKSFSCSPSIFSMTTHNVTTLTSCTCISAIMIPALWTKWNQKLNCILYPSVWQLVERNRLMDRKKKKCRVHQVLQQSFSSSVATRHLKAVLQPLGAYFTS